MSKIVKSRICLNVECGKTYTPKNFCQTVCSPKCQLAVRLAKYKGKPVKVKKPKEIKRDFFKKVKVSADMKKYIAVKSEMREAQIKKLGYTYCEVCMKAGAVDFHHIMFRSRFPKHPLLHTEDNLIMLCRKHHAELHLNNDKNEALIEKRNLKELFKN